MSDARTPRHPFERLESRVLLSGAAGPASVGVAAGPPLPEPGVGLENGTLTIVGTAGADTVTVARDGSGDVRVTFNGDAQTFDGGLVGVIAASLGDGDDTLSVGELGGRSVRVDGGAGTDTLSLAATGERAGVRLLPGQVLDDFRDVRHSNVESLAVVAGDADEAFTVDQGAAGTGVKVEAGAGDDVLTFHPGSGQLFEFYGNDGDDRFVYSGTDAADSLIIRGPVLGVPGSALILADAETIEVDTAGGADNIELAQTVNTVRMVVNAGAGDDTIVLGDNFSRTMQSLAGVSEINGQDGIDTIEARDTGEQSNTGYTIDGGAIVRSGAAPAFYSGVERVNVDGGFGISGFVVIPAEATAISVSGNFPEPRLGQPPSGDFIALRLSGAEGMTPAELPASGGTVTFSNRQPVSYSGTEVAVLDNTIVNVTERKVFYNDSSYDGSDDGADGSDDAAVAPDKQALLPGGAASFANVTSYVKGINGIIIDLQGLPPSGLALRPQDFGIKVGTGGDPATWAAGPAPREVLVRPADGTRADRIHLVWDEAAIRNQWVQVTVPASVKTGLPSPDVFYFGNLVGETGDAPAPPFRVSALDLAAVKRGLNTNAAITSRLDFNRDGRVNALDLSAARQRLNRTLAAPVFPPPAAPAFAAPPRAGDEQPRQLLA